MSVFNRLACVFKPPAKKEIFSEDLKQINKKFIILRNQVFSFSILSYILYYFTRQAYTVAGSALESNGSITKMEYALMGTIFAVVYGGAKFIVGNVADRSSGRVIMIFGLFVSSILNIIMGGVVAFAGTKISVGPFVMMLSLIAMLAVFQGMGWPATARLFSHWFTDKERSGRIGIWNSGQNIGAALLPVVVISLVTLLDPGGTIYGLYFWIPSIFALAMIPLCLWGLRDRPEAEGLPTVEKWKGVLEHKEERVELNWKEIFVKYILKNKFLWILAFANIWVYVVRQGLAGWTLILMKDIHGLDLKHSKWFAACFELSGLFGGISAAYFAKWFFNNRKAPLMIFGLLIALCGLVLLQVAPRGNMPMLITALMIAGFGIYMPQAMIGATAIELTNKKAAATASGFTGLSGYFLGDALFSKVVIAGIGNENWDYVFYYFYGCIAAAIISLALLWTKNQDNKIL
ncbi:MFS transporter [Spiroplasma endosymbiont of Lasioglossum malachurum]|uniref:MFS transporter n=1 Tax=Spiroplasma endosymbiont of Lasioglossum malachurum TaxID=3066319 RepID=UPI0030D11D8F